MAASFSVTGDRAVDAMRNLTMASILAIFDATLRLQAAGDVSPVSELITGTLVVLTT